MKEKIIIVDLLGTEGERKKIFHEVLDKNLASTTIGRRIGRTDCVTDDQGKKHCNLLLGDYSLIRYLKKHNYRYEIYTIVKGKITKWMIMEKGKIVPGISKVKINKSIWVYIISEVILIKKGY